MNTEIIKIDPNDIDASLIDRAAEVIRRGGLVVFPTETVYGLGANTFAPEAVAKIYAAKGRPADNPLISHICSIEQVDLLAREVPAAAYRLMERFWGGPLTIILKRKASVPDIVSAGLDTVSIRMPSHSVAYELIRRSGVPIAAPSANLSGSPSPTTARHAAADMTGRADMIIDGGDSLIGVESTVVDLTGLSPVILRPGAVTAEDIASVTGSCAYGGDYANAPKCPGMKYTHYSPRADVWAVNDISNIKNDENSVILTYGENMGGGAFYAGKTVEDYAAKLFYFLRRADEEGYKTVYARLPDETGIGIAVRNRLLKSAGGKVI